MSVQPYDPDQFWDVHIYWQRPIAYKRIIEDGCQHDQDANLYHILGRFSTHPFKSLYVGRTYNQCVSTRLCQKDHRSRYAAFIKNYPRHTFWVSCGVVEIVNGKRTKKRINDIETILINTNDSDHAFNIANVYGHGVKGSYSIENHGYRCGLPRRLHLGLFTG
jgi:hypothetical protein